MRHREAAAGYNHRLKNGFYDADLSRYRIKFCPNPQCPEPDRTYASVKVCPFCGTPLEYEEAEG